MNSIVFCAIALAVGAVTFIVVDFIVYHRVKW